MLLDGLSVAAESGAAVLARHRAAGRRSSRSRDALAREIGSSERDWDRRLGELGSAARLRVRLGRALALDPAIVLFEHPSAGLAREEVVAMGRDIRGVLERRHRSGGRALASLTLTADLDFAGAVATRVLTLDPASGRLSRSAPPQLVWPWHGESVE